MNDATTALLRALRAALPDGWTPLFEEIRSRSWASATFAGARHELRFRLEGAGAEEAAEAFLSGLDAREFSLRGHFVADIALGEQQRLAASDGTPQVTIAIEALTVEED